MVLYLQGDLDQALDHQRRSLTMLEEALGGKHPQVAVSLVELARVELARSEEAAALQHARRALEIRRGADVSPNEQAPPVDSETCESDSG